METSILARTITFEKKNKESNFSLGIKPATNVSCLFVFLKLHFFVVKFCQHKWGSRTTGLTREDSVQNSAVFSLVCISGLNLLGQKPQFLCKTQTNVKFAINVERKINNEGFL